MKITVIGCNSVLYNNIKHKLIGLEIKELSHKNLNTVNEIVNPIVFSYSKKSLEDNLNMIDLIIRKSVGKIVYISTTAVLACHTTTKYSYPRLKKRIENHIISRNNVSIIRIGVVENLFDKSKISGLIKYSSIDKIVKSINKAYRCKNKVIDSWETVNLKSNFFYNFFFEIELFLFKIFKTNFYLTRFFDIFFKIIGFKNYGYTFLSNIYKKKKYKNIVVGTGMSSLGVLNGIKDSSKEINSTIIIHSYSSKNIHSVNNKTVEYVGSGGNSNYWHSVISIFLKKKNIDFSRSIFLRLFYSLDYDLFKKGYSFIPFMPLRPLKKISKIIDKKHIIDDEVIFVEKAYRNSDKLIIHTKKGTFYSNRIFLCTGTISSLDLLFKSNFIKQDRLVLSEHLVGYFGQMKFKSKYNIDKSIFKFYGHFKRFHNILLNRNRSLYVTARPALFGFKSLEVASSHRDFFGRGSTSIFFNLIRKFNFALILEAIYNKFGLNLLQSRLYNIAGHIESKNSVRIKLSKNETPKITYEEKKVTLNQDDIHNINEYLNSIYDIESINIPNKISVSPGLHFLNCSDISLDRIDLGELSRYCIYPFGTYLFRNDAPTHPTFDLFIHSYLETKKILC